MIQGVDVEGCTAANETPIAVDVTCTLRTARSVGDDLQSESKKQVIHLVKEGGEWKYDGAQDVPA